jgi:predicted nucleotidyltransferase
MILREKDRQTLMSIFSSINYPMDVLAYGSRVNGEAHDGSDLDLAVCGKNSQSLPIDVYFKLLKKIQDSNIPILVDIKDFYALPSKFRQSIESKHEVFYHWSE